jgi:uncharacterized protein (TIGR02246 family)
MENNNKAILQKANAAIAKGDYEGFLSYCTEETEWVFVGEQTLKGKEAVRQYMAEAYKEPPKFVVDNLIAEDDYVIATGTITVQDGAGGGEDYMYCDIWHFKNGKMDKLKAFVIKPH